MIVPVRCYTCGKILGNKWETYVTLAQTEGRKSALDKLGLTRWCCRSVMMTHRDLIDEILEHNARGKPNEKECRKSVEKRELKAR